MLQFSGDRDAFFESEHGKAVAQEEEPEEKVKTPTAKPTVKALKNLTESAEASASESSGVESEESETESDEEDAAVTKSPRKLIEEENRAVGSVKSTVWKNYFGASGNAFFWLAYVIIFVGAKLAEVGETWWLRLAPSQSSLSVASADTPLVRLWSGSYDVEDSPRPPARSLNFYLGIYALLTLVNSEDDMLLLSGERRS
jgi:hypothetical protein